MNRDKGEEYINKFPKLKKWINECIICHKKGYDPNIPNQISIIEGALDVYYIKKYFQPLSVNEQKICGVCEQILARKNKD